MASRKFGWKSGKVHAKGLKVNDHRMLESIYLPANQLSLDTSGTAAAAGQQDDVPVNVHTHNADDEATFSVLVPEGLDSGKMEVYVYWLSADTAGGTVHFDIDYRVTSSGSDVGAGSASNVTSGEQTDSSTANVLNVSSAIEVPASDLTPGAIFHGLFYNDNGEGTIDDDVKVVGLKVVFKE